jgi:pimeloyl-ACP methyl ester carboxylesterase
MSSTAEPRHATTNISRDVRIHHLEAGTGPRVALLVHGFPETANQWLKVVPALVAAGFRVIAPDYRGAGGSSKPVGGYDKMTMAGDLRRLLREHLQITRPILLVGHDIGAGVAAAYALAHREEVAELALVDAPLPGTSAFERMRGDPRGWHAAFHSARDIAELLVQGRERAYLQHMIAVRIYDPTAISPRDLDGYVRAYEAPGAMRAAFELYRAFEQDGEDLRAALARGGKLTIPTVCVTGALSGLGPVMSEMVGEIAANVRAVVAPGAGHWVPEENPAALADALLALTSTAPGRG